MTQGMPEDVINTRRHAELVEAQMQIFLTFIIMKDFVFTYCNAMTTVITPV